MNGYMNYKDVQNTLGVGKVKAYEIIRTISKETGFDKTYECKMLPSMLIPIAYFKDKFPNAELKIEKS